MGASVYQATQDILVLLGPIGNLDDEEFRGLASYRDVTIFTWKYQWQPQLHCTYTSRLIHRMACYSP